VGLVWCSSGASQRVAARGGDTGLSEKPQCFITNRKCIQLDNDAAVTKYEAFIVSCLLHQERFVIINHNLYFHTKKLLFVYMYHKEV
jgi:hypothetical protein